MPTKVETTLALRIANGDRQAEKELFQRYDEQIRFMVLSRLRRKISSADLEDLIGDIRAAALLILRKGGYDPDKGSSLGAYLVGIVARVVAQHFRKQSKSQAAESDLQAIEPANPGTVLDDMMTTERDQRIRRCLSRLDLKYREVLLLRFYENLSIQDIATTLNLERRRVSERIHYALKKLVDEYKRTN